MNKKCQSIKNLFLEQRQIILHGPIDSTLALQVCTELVYLDRQSQEPIEMVISSPGGEVLAGLQIIDTMRMIESPVHTIGMGLIASMASIILLMGDERFLYPNAKVMVHQPYGKVSGQVSDIKIAASEFEETKTKLNRLLAQNSNLDMKSAERLTDRDTYLSPQEALQYGIIDKVLQWRKPVKKSRKCINF